MTKFVLHGGKTSVRNEENKNFYKEVAKDLSENPKILLCLFSIDESRWVEEYRWAKKNFVDNLNRDDLDFKLAEKEDFMNQLKWADAVHFRGGDTLKILEVLKKYPEFKNSLAGKTISGSSAGAYFPAKNFYENDKEKIFQGLGILSINIIAHYGSENYNPISDETFEELKNKDGLELVLLEECEYKIIKLEL